MTQGHISDAKPVKHPQHACAVGDLMEAFHADEAGDAATLKSGQDVIRVIHEAKRLGIRVKQVV